MVTINHVILSGVEESPVYSIDPSVLVALEDEHVRGPIDCLAASP